MKNKKKIWMISFISFGIGVVLLAVAWGLGGVPGFYFDKSGVHSANDALNDVVAKGNKELEAFESMELELESADLEIVESDRFAIDYCVDASFGKPSLKVENGKLTFKKAKDKKIWFFYFFGGVGAKNEEPQRVKIEVPRGTKFQEIVIDSENADMKLPSLAARRIDLKSDYGDIVMEDVSCGQLKISMENGNLSANKIDADGTEIENDYGDVEIQTLAGKKFCAELENGKLVLGELAISDAEITSEYGDVEISHATGGGLKVDIENGNFNIASQSLNVLKAECDYGDVNIGLERKMEEYSFKLETEYGEIRLPDGKAESSHGDEMRYQSGNDASYRVNVKCENGDIVIY